MEIDREKQAQAIAKAKQSLLQAEIKREETRLGQSADLFLQANFDVLLNDEFTESLASHIIKLYRGNQRKTAIQLLEQLEASVCSESTPVRERSLIIILILSEHIFNNNISELSSIIARTTNNWLNFETEFIAGFEPVCQQIQKLAVQMLSTEQWYEVEQLIITINKISTKTLPKSNLIHGVVARIHEKMAAPEALEILLNAYLSESSQRRDVVENILINLGYQGSRFLVEKLVYSNDKDERLALVDLIPRVGGVIIPVLNQYLELEQPWFVIRNIIMIFSRLGDDTSYNDVDQYLSHPDIRVQQQVINCIEVLAGEHMRRRLIQALFVINDELKAHLVDQLVQFDGSDIETALLDLLDQRESFSNHIHNFLVAKLCGKLVSYPSPRTVNTLLNLVEERNERYGSTDSVVRAASETLHTIELDTSNESKLEIDLDAEQIDRDVNAILEDAALTQIPADLSHSDEIDMDGGLSDLFVESFTDTPLEKSKPEVETDQPYSSQDHHLMVWSGFYEQLSTEEVNNFFGTLTSLTLQANEPLIRQGETISNLYFIDQGYASITHSGKAGEIFLTPLQAGEIIGSEGFIDALMWSVTLQAQTELKVRVLEQKRFNQLTETLPDLKDKLYTYCRRHDIVPYLIQAAGSNPLSTVDDEIEIRCLTVFFKDGTGRIDESEIRGTLQHTMQGGFSFTVSYTDHDNISSSLGHQISADIEFKDGTLQKCFGVIAGGGSHIPDQDVLFFHVKLYHPLEHQQYRCKSLEIM